MSLLKTIRKEEASMPGAVQKGVTKVIKGFEVEFDS